MAKKEIRAITASGDMVGIIDHGFDVDTSLKNLTFEDKGIKSKITGDIGSQMDGESSVRIVGSKAAAVVTAVEKVSLDMKSEKIGEVKDLARKGLFGGAVEVKPELAIPPMEIRRAAEILSAAGISASIIERVELNSERLKEMNESASASVEEEAARKILKDCLVQDTTFRVKYERL